MDTLAETHIKWKNENISTWVNFNSITLIKCTFSSSAIFNLVFKVCIHESEKTRIIQFFSGWNLRVRLSLFFAYFIRYSASWVVNNIFRFRGILLLKKTRGWAVERRDRRTNWNLYLFFKALKLIVFYYTIPVKETKKKNLSSTKKSKSLNKISFKRQKHSLKFIVLYLKLFRING